MAPICRKGTHPMGNSDNTLRFQTKQGGRVTVIA